MAVVISQGDLAVAVDDTTNKAIAQGITSVVLDELVVNKQQITVELPDEDDQPKKVYYIETTDAIERKIRIEQDEEGLQVKARQVQKQLVSKTLEEKRPDGSYHFKEAQTQYREKEQSYYKKVSKRHQSQESLEMHNQLEEHLLEKATVCCCRMFTYNCCKCCHLYSITDNLNLIRTEGIMQIRLYKSFFGEILRECLVYLSVIVSLVNLIWDIVCVSINANRYANTQLVFSILLFFFAISDGAYNFYYRRCYVCKKAKRKLQKHLPNTCSNNTNYMYESNRENEPDSRKFCREKCTRIPEPFTTTMDVIRIFFIEMMFYPQLLLTMFAFTEKLIENNHEIVIPGLIKFIYSIVKTIVFVYVARMLVLGETVWSIQKIRRANTKEFSCEGASFHILFVVQAYGQMAIQICMIIAIGLKHHTEYNGYNMEYNMTRMGNESIDFSYTPSNALWYMMFTAYIAPTLGLMVFLLVHYYWIQKFPMKLILDMMETLKEPENLDSLKVKKNIRNFEKVARNLMSIQKDYGNFSDVHCLKKLIYPFINPLHCLPCLVYAAIMLAYGFCTIVSGAYSEFALGLYITGPVLTLIVNYYTMAVVTFWMPIICSPCGIILLLLLIVAGFAII